MYRFVSGLKKFLDRTILGRIKLNQKRGVDMAKVEDVAKYIIRRTKNIDNLKLQKLLYYCQAVNLVETGKPLFNDKIEAWLYGPVVPSMYREYKKYGESYIPVPSDNIASSSITTEEVENIDMTLRFYGKFSGPELIDRTHLEKPWINAFNKGANTEITKDALKEYFSEALKIS